MKTAKYKLKKNRISLNNILNVIINIMIFLSTLAAVYLIIIDNFSIWTEILAIALNRLKLDLRIWDIEIYWDFKKHRIRKRKGGFYD